MGRSLKHDDDIVITARAGAFGGQDRPEQQELSAGKALPHLHFVLRYFRHEDRIARAGQREQRQKGQQHFHSGATV